MNMSSDFFNIALLAKSTGSLLTSPRRFFSGEGKTAHWPRALQLVTLSALLAAGAVCIVNGTATPWFGAALFVFNAVGLVLISAVFGILIIRLIPAVHVSFGQLFAIYAFSGSLPILISWIPGAFLTTEAWRWCLIGIGLTRSCGLLWRQALVVIAGSIGLTMIVFSFLIFMSR
jgi:hypothetical protein